MEDRTMSNKETKMWEERIKVCDNDWQGLSLFIDDEGVFDEYEAGGVLKDSADEKLKRFIYHEIEQEAERRGYEKACDKIHNYVEKESGKSGRREILQYIAELKLLEDKNN